MIALKLFSILFAFHSSQCSLQPTIPNEMANKFGPYKAEYSNLQLCNGPKRKDLAKSSARIVKIENSYILYANMTFLEKAQLDHVKTQVYKLKDNKNSILWNNKIDDPCKHFALGEFLQKYFGVNKNCAVLKGDKYYASNLTDFAYKFYGKSFYYGDYYMKSVVFSDKGNLLCLHLNVFFTKLDK